MHLLHDRPRRLGFASSPVMAIGEDHFFIGQRAEAHCWDKAGGTSAPSPTLCNRAAAGRRRTSVSS